MTEQLNLSNPSQTPLIFDGIDDYVGLPAINTDYSQGFTVEVWVLYNSFQRYWSRIIDFGNGPNNYNIVLANLEISNNLKFVVFTSSGMFVLDALNALELNQWMHLAATIDKSGMAKVYKNGQLIQSKQLRLPDNVNRTQNYIGKSNWSNDGYFEGQMTEVRVWNIARTQEEIQQNMSCRLVGNEPGLVTYLPLNGDTKDKSGNGNDATIYGATWLSEKVPLEIKAIASPESQSSKTLEPSSSATTETLNPPGSSNSQTLEPIPYMIISEPSSQPKPQEPTQTTRKKRLVVCCDGTWNQLTNPCLTNVARFARLIKYTANDQTAQLVHYISGCGTGEDDDLIDRLGGGAFGWGIDRIIQDAYRFLCMNYDATAQDEIYLVGFSRGAYIVRCLAGMIYNCGLLRRTNIRKIPEAYELYRDHKISPNDSKAQEFRKVNSKEIDTDQDYLKYREPIKMLGCWDTVGALGIPDVIPWLPIVKRCNKKYEFFDAQLSPIVENAFHAVAIDEKRKSFPSSPMEKSHKNPDQVVKEIWFVGRHGCIGGGIKKYKGLSDYTLRWMIEEAEKLRLEFYSAEDDSEEFQIKPNALTPFDNSVTGIYALGGEEWREIKSPEAIIHDSVIERYKADLNYRPPNLEAIVNKKLPSSNDKT